MLTALAGAAGIAIHNARLYAEAKARRHWLAAVSDVRAALLHGSSTDEALGLVAERVAELTGADAAWVLVGPDPDDGAYVVRAQSGAGLTDSVGVRCPVPGNPVLEVATAASDLVSLDLSGVPNGAPVPDVAWGPALAVPLRSTHGSTAVLLTTRRAGSGPFDAPLRPLLGTFADQVAVALDMAARQRVTRRLDIYEERDRIARDLHDHVIQRVFAAGLALQSVLPRMTDVEARRRVSNVVSQLDQTVRDIRTTIFDLQTTDAADDSDSLRRRLLDLVTETAGDTLQATVRTAGAIDSLVSGDLAGDVEAVAREAVSNAARHSGAGHLTVTLDVSSEVVLEVVDDGRGIDPRAARSGLRNVVRRATRRGGGATVERLPEGGTRLRWWAPLG